MNKVPAKKKSRRKNSKSIFYDLEGNIIESCYCRKCTKDRPPRLFYQASDELLDKNGYFSVCKNCVKEIFSSFYSISHDVKSAIFMTCKALNISFVESCVDATITWVSSRMSGGKPIDGAFGFYKSKVSGLISMNKEINKTFDGYSNEENKNSIVDDPDVEEHDANYLIDFWGDGLKFEDYEFLEKEYSSFKQTHKADTHAEIILLKEVCYMLRKIREERKNNKSTAKLVEDLQKIMKSLAISPNMAKAGNKSNDAFGNWVKEIEEKTPAEWYEDKKLFKDVDGLYEYFMNYIVRPIKNFVTGSRDFTLIEGDKDDDEDEIIFSTD